MTISENQDGTLTVSYTAHKPGYYTGYVLLSSYLATQSTLQLHWQFSQMKPWKTTTDTSRARHSWSKFWVSGLIYYWDSQSLDKVDVTKSVIYGLEKNQEFFVAQTTFRIIAKNSSGETLSTGLLQANYGSWLSVGGENFEVKIEGPKSSLTCGTVC